MCALSSSSFFASLFWYSWSSIWLTILSVLYIFLSRGKVWSVLAIQMGVSLSLNSVHSWLVYLSSLIFLFLNYIVSYCLCLVKYWSVFASPVRVGLFLFDLFISDSLSMLIESYDENLPFFFFTHFYYWCQHRHASRHSPAVIHFRTCCRYPQILLDSLHPVVYPHILANWYNGPNLVEDPSCM